MSLCFYFTLQHWIRLELFPDVLVHRLKMIVDPADSSYMPSLVVVSGGLNLYCAFPECTFSEETCCIFAIYILGLQPVPLVEAADLF